MQKLFASVTASVLILVASVATIGAETVNSSRIWNLAPIVSDSVEVDSTEETGKKTKQQSAASTAPSLVSIPNMRFNHW